MASTKYVVLVSGGLDSFLAVDEMRRVSKRQNDSFGRQTECVLVHIRYGQQYDDMELRAIQELYGDEVNIVNIEGLPPLGDGIHVDARNMMFATLATRFGRLIVMAGMRDETCRDKNPKAFDDMAKILNNHSKNEYQVYSPFWNKSKAEAVRHYLKNGGDSSVLTKTVSCYGGGDEPCNDCQACFRRFIALAANGISVPRPSDRIIAEYGLSRIGKSTASEQIDIINALQTIKPIHFMGNDEIPGKKGFFSIYKSDLHDPVPERVAEHDRARNQGEAVGWFRNV